MENKSLDLMNRMGLITEKSISAKKKDIKNVTNFFNKGKSGYNAIKCFAVLTAENPDSIKATNQFNKIVNNDLYTTLKKNHYNVIPTSGKFGNVEHSYMVFNIKREVVAELCGKYQQTSFIYSYIENEKLISEYWEKENILLPFDNYSNPYIMKDKCDDWVNMENADDFYTIVGNKFKYSIPFSIFENVNNHYNSIIENENYDNKDKIIERLIEGVGYSAYYNRARFLIKK